MEQPQRRIFRGSGNHQSLAACLRRLVMLLALPAVIGCTGTRVIPPTQVADPDTVWLVQYDGYHASLVFDDGDQLVEYAYGDWQYYALSDHGFLGSGGLTALLVPTQGTLGRRLLTRALSDEGDLCRIMMSDDPCRRILALRVEKARLDALKRKLDIAWAGSLATEVVNRGAGLNFVKYDRHYTLWHNCNHELADWLDALDVRVEGTVWLADFDRARAVD